MGADTKIEWATHTANAWIGCTKVSPACDHCYAERGSKRMGVEWGDQAERRMTNWLSLANNVRKWDRAAQAAGERHRVFWNSCSDFLEGRPELEGRRFLACAVMADTPQLDHLILTKRPENAWELMPELWTSGMWPKNVWFGTTAENQRYYDERTIHLHRLLCPVRFISIEPLLGSINLGSLRAPGAAKPYYDWVIVGGESGLGARPMHPDWARSLRDQCTAAGVPFFFKQWGGLRNNPDADDPTAKGRSGSAKGGRRLDGRTWDEMPGRST